ncbi:aminoglycoside phosphotransferase family protein [Paractinoplanes hotanensis]|uniref:Aminoglycoside phosphotransferase family protein n=1 Tax=Paractinoplanes hotanensis TaxID=2906497 RepID=A0ABT0YAU3_9ACTN|nr:aminoglycoside phosphotransferase family protein [Actinoplanes hotanensis]MCM4083158.1 aminoglycoside phosphotransferase family protein [Actinoplanes hotanensis]
MHADEVRASRELVRRLVAAQCPQWAGLPVAELPGEVEGTDHVLFRLGDELVARMPKIGWAVGQAESDARWLPLLAPLLPVRIPVPVFVGEPGFGYPWRWSVVPWLPGSTPPRLGSDDAVLARDLASFVHALHAVDPVGGPVAKAGGRGAPLRDIDASVRRGMSLLSEEDGLDRPAVEAAWEKALAAPEWHGDPVWVHGDLQPGNLITEDGRLTAVVDFGTLGVGDPAVDVAAALWTFTGGARQEFRQAAGCDDATWRRACGWALASLNGIDYYRHTFPRMAEHGRRMVRAAIAELG